MKILVSYWSQTGNTKKVAEAIYDALPGDKTIKPFDEVDSLDGFNLSFIGFPVMQFGPPAPARKFIAAHAPGRKIALFITHAIPSGSHEQQQQAVLEKELEKCKALCLNSELIGLFHCQGELSKQISDELMATGIPMLREFAGMRALTIGHPDEQELEQAKIFALSVTTP